MFDNDTAFNSQEMTDYLNTCNPPIPRIFSCAYHQHQNGVAEALWARLVPLVRIFIQAAPWLGTEFWTEAMDYANECICRRPSRANDGHAVPNALFDGVDCVRDDHLRQWGYVVYVHEDGAHGFNVRAKKGYLVNLSKQHTDGVYAIYMCDTKRIRHTMNVIFMEDCTIAPDEMPPVIDFDMTNNYVTPITDNVADATFTTVTQSGPSVPSVTKTPFPHPPVAMGSATAVPVDH